MELSIFLVSAASAMATNYNDAYMEHCNHANFKVAVLEQSILTAIVWLIIHNRYVLASLCVSSC